MVGLESGIAVRIAAANIRKAREITCTGSAGRIVPGLVNQQRVITLLFNPNLYPKM
jgi:hypothetical protein